MKREACFQAASILTDALMGLLPSLEKFDFFSHPSAVVLSVIDRTQSWGLRRPAMMSTQGDMTAARCSSRLFEALESRWSGSYHLHAHLSLLYPPPPDPAGHESDL
jgi:hypothetical protein